MARVVASGKESMDESGLPDWRIMLLKSGQERGEGRWRDARLAPAPEPDNHKGYFCFLFQLFTQ